VLTVVGFFVFMQVFVWISGLLKKGKKLGNIKGELGRHIQSGKKSLVYFYSPACGACRAMTPMVDKMKKEFKEVFSVNLAKDMDTARVFGVMGTPATVIVENGEIRKFVLGARSEKFLRDLIQ
jgi:thioredoxin 1